MALTILYGSSVSVKNEYMLDTILREAEKHPEYSYVVLVPEQASLYTQEEMVRRSKRHALMNIDVLTFNRLAYRVFGDLGEKSQQMIDDNGKLMLLRLVAKELEDELVVLRKNLSKQGFLTELKSLFSEFSEYNVTPDKLSESAAKLSSHPALQRKLSELSLLYRAFLRRLHQNYEMAEERLSRLARCMDRWQPASDTVFSLTGFTGFTPPQEAVLSSLLESAREIILTADLGSGCTLYEQREEDDLFHMTYTMCSRMKEAAIKKGLPIREETITETAGISGSILKIEAGLFRHPEKVFPEGGEGIRVLSADTPEAEVRVLIGEILRLLRSGMRLRDMAVISGNPSCYHEEIEDKMRELSLPVFFDETRALTENPLFRLVMELLDVFEESYSFESVITLLKNPLYIRYLDRQLKESKDGLSAYDRVCEFENFCLARGVRGKNRFEKAFTGRYRRFEASRLPAVNELREEALAPVFILHEGLMKRGALVFRRIEALREFLASLNTEEEMKALSEAEERLDLSREYAGSEALLMDFFEKTAALLHDEVLPFEAFSELMRSGIASLRMGLVPPSRDELLVGDLMRTRLQGIRHLFVIGANEGLLPSLKESGGLLSDSDREILGEASVILSPTAREESFFAPFYLYRLFTGAKESVTVIYAHSDGSGRSLNPAPVVGKLLRLFPKLSIETQTVCAEAVETAQDGLLYTAGRFRESFFEEGKTPLQEGDWALASWLFENPDSRKSLKSILEAAAFRYQPEKLSEESASALFGGAVQESVSRLEKYAACPFSHFLSYGLMLSERPEYQVDRADLGTILHDCINRFFEMMNQKKLRFDGLSEPVLAGLSEAAVQAVTEEYGEGLMQDSARNRYLIVRVSRLVARTVAVLKKQWEAGDYDETETEVPFGLGYPFMPVRLSPVNRADLFLQGRIDRMDLSRRSEGIYVKIIDYKSGKKSLDYTKIWYGLQLQLLLYLEAAKSGLSAANPRREIIPAGVYYYHIDDPMVDAKDEKEAEELIEKSLQLSGLTNSSPEAIRLIDREFSGSSSVVASLRKKKDGSFYDYAKVATGQELQRAAAFSRKKAEEIVGEMLSGEVGVQPYRYGEETACSYCPYRSVCGYDERIPGYRMRRLKKKELKDLSEDEHEVDT